MKTHNNCAYPDIMVFDDICDEDLLDLIYSRSLEEGPRIFPFYEKNENFDLDPLFQKIKKLVSQVWLDKLSYLLPETFAGWEVWSNLMVEDMDLSVHIDCDERADGWVLPYWGCVIYTGPKEIDKNMKGGELNYNLDLKEKFINAERDTAVNLNDCNKPIVVPYRYNRVVIFNQAPHLVKPVQKLTDPSKPRMGISCAVWEHAIDPITTEERVD
jgi:hypothetical protein